MRTTQTSLLAVAVALAFADSSIVVLALPDLLGRFDASVADVAWVVTAYNLAVAVGAAVLVPAARRADPAKLARAGLAVFAASSAACAASSALWLLVAFRGVQGLGGALVLVGSLPLLGTGDRGSARWAFAGAMGAALGPAAGGALTQLFDWRAIFTAQAPVAAAALLAVRRAPARPEAAAAFPRLSALGANTALGLLSGALVGALFLVVVLLVNAWNLAPLAAAGVVSTIPLATVVGGRLARRADERQAAVLGILLLAAGLAALALLPASEVGWAAAGLAFCGLGIGAAVPTLTRVVFRRASRAAATGASTVAVRHGGLVLGLLLLTPLLAHDLSRGVQRAKLVGTGLVLDAPLPASTKVPLAIDLARQLQRAPKGEVPDFSPQFRRPGPPRALHALDRALAESVRAVVTRSFRTAFALSALLALAALVPAAALRRRP